MALHETAQFMATLKDSNRVLLLPSATDGGDALASALALKSIITGLGKSADVVHFASLPRQMDFLPGYETVQNELTHLQKFIIKVDVSKNPVDSLTYDVKDGTLSIHLTPKYGLITKHDLRTAHSAFKYDLIITLGIADLSSLGDMYHQNPDLFYRTPIMNVDCQAGNERYGHVNLVDMTAVSVAEILYRALKTEEAGFMTAPVATALFTGLTIATKSFKDPRVTPVVLRIASDLIDAGADRTTVVHRLYRTRSLGALRLWGQALAHLKHDAAHGLVWTGLTRDDFARTGGTPADVRDVIDELIANSPEAKVTVVLYETETAGTVEAIVATEKQFDARELGKRFGGTGTKRSITFSFPAPTIAAAEAIVVPGLIEAIATH